MSQTMTITDFKEKLSEIGFYKMEEEAQAKDYNEGCVLVVNKDGNLPLVDGTDFLVIAYIPTPCDIGGEQHSRDWKEISNKRFDNYADANKKELTVVLAK